MRIKRLTQADVDGHLLATGSDLDSPLGPLGGVKNLRVTDPTMTSLNVNWDAADGAVRLYKVFYVPAAGGLEELVRP